MPENPRYGPNRRGPYHTIPDRVFDRSVQIKLPFHFDEFGMVASTRNRAEQIADNLATITATGIRERVMRPGFGSRVRGSVFESNDEILRSMLADDLRRAYARWEPEAKIHEVAFRSGMEMEYEIEQGLLTLEVVFSLVESDEGDQPRYSASIDLGGGVEDVRIL